MRFTSAVVLALAGAAAATPIAAPVPVVESGVAIEERAILSGEVDADMEKRQIDPITASILLAVGTAAATKLTNVAIDSVIKLIKDVSSFTEAREKFTKQTTAAMWDAADKKVYSAAICYNMGYTLKNPSGIDGKTSVKLKQGLLNVDYDCFLMKAGANALYTNGDGGFQNLAVQHDQRCTYDSKSADLTCN